MLLEDREALQKARDLIADRDKWTTFARGRTASDINTLENDPRAVKWCVAGALGLFTGDASESYWRIMQTLGDKAAEIFPDKIAESCGSRIVHVNNFMGHESTLAVVDKVLADERVT